MREQVAFSLGFVSGFFYRMGRFLLKVDVRELREFVRHQAGLGLNIGLRCCVLEVESVSVFCEVVMSNCREEDFVYY